MWPSIALATAGVVISAGVVSAAIVLMFRVSWADALLLGAVPIYPTVVPLLAGVGDAEAQFRWCLWW